MRAQQGFADIPIEGIEHRDFEGVRKGVCPFADCDDPILSLIDLVLHVRDKHDKDVVAVTGRKRPSTTSPVPQIQCHRCLSVMTFQEGIFHHVRCLAVNFPDYLGKRKSFVSLDITGVHFDLSVMDERASSLGLQRMFIVPDAPRVPQERFLLGELAEAVKANHNDATVAALVQSYRNDELVKWSVDMSTVCSKFTRL